ncbi:MAG: ShlB/FhaC/HecB family hemolysin secretion/activation protein [Chlorobiaceae bacterium]
MSASLTILLFISMLLTNSAFAIDIPDAGRLLKENTPPTTLIPRPALPPLQKQVTPKEQAQGGATVKVSGFIFRGNTLFSSSELAALMSGSIGKEMTFAELNAAAAVITGKYRDKGYFLAYVYFPPQSIKPGLPLVIEVVEGILETIQIITLPDKTRTPKSLLQSYARHLSIDKPVKEGPLTSVVMRTNELPNISSRIMLEPGSRPGTTKATLEVTEGRPCSVSLDMDNYGNDATGNNRAGVTLELYSPLHLGDQFTMHLQTSTTGDLQNVRGTYAMPITSFGTKIGIDYNFVTYKLGGSFKALNADGDAHNLSLSITHPIVRQRDLILNATAAGEGKLLDDRIDNPQSRNKRHTESCQLGLSGLQMDRVFGGGSTSFNLGVIAGILGITDSETLSIDQSSTGLHTNGNYLKVNMSLARTQTIYHGLSLYAGTYGQWSNKNLNSSEQLSLGGPYAIRAWQIDESYADKGFITTAELRCQLGQIGEIPGSMEASAFVDNGYALLHANPPPDGGANTRNLTGAGIGVKWLNTDNSMLQATCAWKVKGETTPENSPMIFVQAVKRF